jgi:hypothetical protein
MPKGKAPMVSMPKAKQSKDPQQGEALEMTEKVSDKFLSIPKPKYMKNIPKSAVRDTKDNGVQDIL